MPTINKAIMHLGFVRDGISSSQLSINDAIDKAIGQYTLAKAINDGLTSLGTGPPTDGT